MLLDAVLFYLFAALAVASAVVVVAQRNPTYSAFGLIVTLASLSGIFGLLGSPFIAVLQLIVYAGAIMVLFLFVLMLLSVKEEERIEGGWRTVGAVGLVLVVLLVAQMAAVFLKTPQTAVAAFHASTDKVARVLFSPAFLYAFEATSVLILAALVGAIVLAKKDL